MSIVTKRAGNVEYGHWMKLLIVGEPGSGKTLISSTFPYPYYANAEGGLMSVASRQVPYAEIRSIEDLFELKTFLDLSPELRQASLGVRVDTIIIDTIDEIQRILIRERLAAEKITQLRISDFGWLGEQMQGILRGFRNLDMNVVFTCHIRDSKDDESGRVFWKPALQGAISGDIAGYVDLSLWLSSKTQTVLQDNEAKQVPFRFLQTYPDPQHPWIKDRSGKLPETFPVNFQDDYQRLHDTIFAGIGDVPESEIMAPAVASLQENKEKEQPPKELAIMPDGEFTCDTCGDLFNDGDQATLSRLKVRKILCKPCYKDETTKKGA